MHCCLGRDVTRTHARVCRKTFVRRRTALLLLLLPPPPPPPPPRGGASHGLHAEATAAGGRRFENCDLRSCRLSLSPDPDDPPLAPDAAAPPPRRTFVLESLPTAVPPPAPHEPLRL